MANDLGSPEFESVEGRISPQQTIAPARGATGPYAAYEKVVQPEKGMVFGTGWLPPMPDLRDYTPVTPVVAEMSARLGISPGHFAAALPSSIDLRRYCSPIDNQGALGSCTAHAAVGIVEYFQNRSYESYVEGSKLFVYKVTRNLMNVQGDTGAYLRYTMAALTYCGVPPEKYWPYTTVAKPGLNTPHGFDDEPSTFVYELAENYEAISYFRHDPSGVTPDTVLKSVKTYLAHGVPCMFGFFGFPSWQSGDVRGAFPVPCKDEQAIWGHAVAAVGYDDTITITNKRCGLKSTGALLIRNSWGADWGDQGYGWLPYEYVQNSLAVDFWSILGMRWVDTRRFGLETMHH
ncbi:C1 family peptidase [Hyalangium gracile]|uniref:C1 family peptidase n=1 Tax=Hyalangium gracile TaxID=394092 RepID=UPI001CD0173E|nr:C1 family peptidase [Hyalangium gracile]